MAGRRGGTGGGSAPGLVRLFGEDGGYRDIPGLCNRVTRADMASEGWSLNPGRYSGVTPGEQVEDEDFRERLAALQEELEGLNAKRRVYKM